MTPLGPRRARAPLTPRERRLRRALVAAAGLAALAVIGVAAVLFYWSRYLLPPEPDPFTRGPYVTRIGTTTATLRWRIDRDRPVTIAATTPDGRTVTSTDGVLRGLAPGARQGWVAVVGGRARAAGTLTTAPVDPRATVRFLAFGDYGEGGGADYAVGRVSAAQQPAFSVIPGDNAYLASVAAVLDRNVFAPRRALLAQGPFVATLGEHDLFFREGRDLADALELPNGGDRWVFDYGPLRFVMLGLKADEGDVPFVQRALTGRDARRTYLVVHHPPRAGNPVLAAAAGRLAAVFAGHLHLYERLTVDGVPVFIVGTGGAPRNADERFTPHTPGAAVSLAVFGVLRIDDRPDGVRLTFIDEAGAVRDRARLP